MRLWVSHYTNVVIACKGYKLQHSAGPLLLERPAVFVFQKLLNKKQRKNNSWSWSSLDCTYTFFSRFPSEEMCTAPFPVCLEAHAHTHLSIIPTQSCSLGPMHLQGKRSRDRSSIKARTGTMSEPSPRLLSLRRQSAAAVAAKASGKWNSRARLTNRSLGREDKEKSAC